MAEKKIDVKMFHTFSLTYDGQTITAVDIKSDKLLKLMAYCLYHHDRAVPSNELIDFLWSMEDVDNPIGALKNLVYRLRTLLKKKLNLTDLVVTGKAAYAINQDYEVSLDTEKFEELYAQLKEDPTEETYDALLKVYKGKYLSEIEYNQFVMTRNVYYHSTIMNVIKEYCALLEKEENYEKMEKVAGYAVSLGELEEDSYELLVRALYLEKHYKQATDVYKRAVDLLYRYLGTNPSLEMRELYDQIQKETHEDFTSIYEIQKNLDADAPAGALLCEYGTFRELYSMQARMMDRLGVSTHLCLLTVNDSESYDEDNPEKKRKYLEKTMQRMRGSLVDGLRIGDIVTRFSTNQYLVLLPSCTYEDAHVVMKRVLKKIMHTLNNKNITIDLAVQEVTSPK